MEASETTPIPADAAAEASAASLWAPEKASGWGTPFRAWGRERGLAGRREDPRSRAHPPSGSARDSLRQLPACSLVCSGVWPGAWGRCPVAFCMRDFRSSWGLLESESAPPELLVPFKGSGLHSTLFKLRSAWWTLGSEPCSSAARATGCFVCGWGSRCLRVTICSLAALLLLPASPSSSLPTAGWMP